MNTRSDPRIDAVSTAEVKRLAGELLEANAMTVIVVGDKASLAPQFDALGLGGFEERDAYGNPVPNTATTQPSGAPTKPVPKK